jgi:hypothetical protein
MNYITSKIIISLLFFALISGLSALQTQADAKLPPQTGERGLASLFHPVVDHLNTYPALIQYFTAVAYQHFPNNGTLLLRNLGVENVNFDGLKGNFFTTRVVTAMPLPPLRYAVQAYEDTQRPPQSGERVLGSLVYTSVWFVSSDWPVNFRLIIDRAYHEFPSSGTLLLRGHSYCEVTRTNSFLVVSAAPSSSASAMSSHSSMDVALENAIDRALADIPSRSRIGIGHITTRDRTQRRSLTEAIEDILLDHNMRVVDRSEQHVVLEEIGEDSELLANFRHADYVLTVRMDDSSLRVRLINVRNGELAGMATERF